MTPPGRGVNEMVVYATKTKISDAKVIPGKYGQIFYTHMDRIIKLREFLQENPHDSFLKHALALEYIKTGDDKTARQLFEEIIAHEPGYIGTYYHLAKLLERQEETDLAIRMYEHGMDEAKKAGDQHAFGELRGAYEELTF